ncbi:MAG: hypothetical protein V4598_01790 [Bdellovibrionota bacterium]
MKFLLLSLLVLGSCGKKTPAPPLKQESQQSQLRVSPSGISSIQKLFDVYSPTGKLSLQEIKNVATKISPKLFTYIEGLDLQIEPGKKYNASEFFSLLGESNRTLLWALAYDLQTEAGWRRVLNEEFAWSDEGLNDQTLKELRLVLDVSKGPQGQEKFLTLALKIGSAFNVMDSLEPSPGSVIDTVTKHTIYAYSKEALPELTQETIRLVKLNFVIQYALADLNGDSETVDEGDKYARWSLEGMGSVVLANYPALKPALLETLYKRNVTIARLRAASDPENAHKIFHPDAWKILGSASKSDPFNWSAYDAFTLVKSTCKKNNLVMKFDEWTKFFDEKVAGHSYTDPAFCESIKGSDSGNRAPTSLRTAGRKSYPASRAR